MRAPDVAYSLGCRRSAGPRERWASLVQACYLRRILLDSSPRSVAVEDSLMNDAINVMDAEVEKFGIGQPVPRKEDPVLVRGEGRYTDDINLPGQLYAV